MNKNLIDFLPIVAIFLILLLIWFLPNYSLYDYIKEIRLKSIKEKQNEGVLVVCKTCNGTGQTEQDVNLLMAEASFAIWHNGHSYGCDECNKGGSCETIKNKHEEIMSKYKELGPKIEKANCPKCMGCGSYKQYKGYRVGKEKL